MSPRPTFPKGNRAAAKPKSKQVSTDRLQITGPPGFRAALKAAAASHGKSLSTWCRETLLQAAKSQK